MAIFLKMHSIRAFKHELDKFVLMPIYFLGVEKYKQLVYACIYRKMHLIDGLKANILVKNNIMALKDLMIDLANFITFISSCNVWIAIIARQRGQPLRKKLMADTTVFLPPNSKSLVSVMHGALLCNRDFFFQPMQQSHFTLFAHLISHDTRKMLVWNDFSNAILIPRNTNLVLSSKLYMRIVFKQFLIRKL